MRVEMDLGLIVAKDTGVAVPVVEAVVVMRMGRIMVRSFGVLNLSSVLLGLAAAAEALALVALAYLEFGFAVYSEVQIALVSHL